MADETQADAGTPRPLTLEWMEVSRDRWMNKAIERKERLTVLLAVAGVAVDSCAGPFVAHHSAAPHYEIDAELLSALRAVVEAARREGE